MIPHIWKPFTGEIIHAKHLPDFSILFGSRTPACVPEPYQIEPQKPVAASTHKQSPLELQLSAHLMAQLKKLLPPSKLLEPKPLEPKPHGRLMLFYGLEEYVPIVAAAAAAILTPCIILDAEKTIKIYGNGSKLREYLRNLAFKECQNAIITSNRSPRRTAYHPWPHSISTNSTLSYVCSSIGYVVAWDGDRCITWLAKSRAIKPFRYYSFDCQQILKLAN